MVSDAVSRVHTLPSLSNTAVGETKCCKHCPKEIEYLFMD